jgi:Transposase DDE domain
VDRIGASDGLTPSGDYQIAIRGKPMLDMLDPTRFEVQLKEALGRQRLRELGDDSGFVIREREITADRFVASLLKSLGSRKVESIADLVRDFNYDHGTSIHYKPYYNRIDTPCFPRLMRLLFHDLLAELATKALQPQADSKLRRFADVIIHDGSSFALHDELAETFAGRFTTISPSAVELHATMSLFGDNMIDVTITGDAECERHHMPMPEELRAALFLADRGYDATDFMLDVTRKGGSFIIRIRKCHDPVVTKIYRQGKRYRKLEGRALSTVLRYAQKGKMLDMDVTWSEEKSFRLVVRWNREKREWVRLMTNLNRSDFTPPDVFNTYRLRWQIELLFKELKSYANLHAFSTIKPNIAEGLIWASLCVAILKRRLAHACQHATGRPISTRKVAMCGHHFFTELSRSMLKGFRTLRATLRNIFEFLEHNARRSNPKRERRRGRLTMRLQPAGAKP